MKKYLKGALCIVLAIGLVGCAGQSGVSDLKEVTTNQTDIVTGDTQEVIEIDFQEQVIPVKVNYNIENEYGWKFTQNSSIDLEIALLEELQGFDIKIGSVYADVSIISKIPKYNGLKQDSIFADYKELSNDGISIGIGNHFSLPFMVKGVNQNETFLYIYNGNGYAGYSRVGENDFPNGLALGAQLNVVWTLFITEKSTGNTFVRTVTSNIALGL